MDNFRPLSRTEKTILTEKLNYTMQDTKTTERKPNNIITIKSAFMSPTTTYSLKNQAVQIVPLIPYERVLINRVRLTNTSINIMKKMADPANIADLETARAKIISAQNKHIPYEPKQIRHSYSTSLLEQMLTDDHICGEFFKRYASFNSATTFDLAALQSLKTVVENIRKYTPQQRDAKYTEVYSELTASIDNCIRLKLLREAE